MPNYPPTYIYAMTHKNLGFMPSITNNIMPKVTKAIENDSTVRRLTEQYKAQGGGSTYVQPFVGPPKGGYTATATEQEQYGKQSSNTMYYVIGGLAAALILYYVVK